MRIEDYIPEEREHAVSRAELVRLTGLPDRSIRQEIKAANRRLTEEGRAILSSSGARGYWVTSDLGELLDYLRESTHRAQSQYLNDAPIRRLALRLSGEETVNVRAYTRRVRKQEGIEGQEKWEV